MPLLFRRETTQGFLPSAHTSGDREESPRGVYQSTTQEGKSLVVHPST